MSEGRVNLDAVFNKLYEAGSQVIADAEKKVAANVEFLKSAFEATSPIIDELLAKMVEKPAAAVKGQSRFAAKSPVKLTTQTVKAAEEGSSTDSDSSTSRLAEREFQQAWWSRKGGCF